MEKTLLILKSAEHTHSAAVSFLTHRGWSVITTDTVKECLDLVVSQKPKFLMISINHNDLGALKLGRALARSIPITIINFSELDNNLSSKKLERSETLYKIFAPLTGPAVERIVNKYYKDLSHSQLTEYKRHETSDSNSDDNSVIAIKGGNHDYTNDTSSSKRYETLNTSKLLKSISTHDQDLELISNSAQQALDECSVHTAPPNNPIQGSSNLACIIVESEKFSGYLIAAMGKNQRVDSAFIEKIRARLFSFLKAQGEAVDESENALNLKIKEVDFEGWALDYAEFLKKSSHKGDEVAMAFFPYAEAKTRFGLSAKEDMVAISLSEIVSDVFLDFNIYLYLAKNDRYVLYTPKGGILYHHQKDKLLLQKIDSLHVYKDDLHSVSALKAQHFLNDKVDQFETNKAVS